MCAFACPQRHSSLQSSAARCRRLVQAAHPIRHEFERRFATKATHKPDPASWSLQYVKDRESLREVDRLPRAFDPWQKDTKSLAGLFRGEFVPKTHIRRPGVSLVAPVAEQHVPERLGERLAVRMDQAKTMSSRIQDRTQQFNVMRPFKSPMDIDLRLAVDLRVMVSTAVSKHVYSTFETTTRVYYPDYLKKLHEEADKRKRREARRRRTSQSAATSPRTSSVMLGIIGTSPRPSEGGGRIRQVTPHSSMEWVVVLRVKRAPPCCSTTSLGEGRRRTNTAVQLPTLIGKAYRASETQPKDSETERPTVASPRSHSMYSMILPELGANRAPASPRTKSAGDILLVGDDQPRPVAKRRGSVVRFDDGFGTWTAGNPAPADDQMADLASGRLSGSPDRAHNGWLALPAHLSILDTPVPPAPESSSGNAEVSEVNAEPYSATDEPLPVPEGEPSIGQHAEAGQMEEPDRIEPVQPEISLSQLPLTPHQVPAPEPAATQLPPPLDLGTEGPQPEAEAQLGADTRPLTPKEFVEDLLGEGVSQVSIHGETLVEAVGL